MINEIDAFSYKNKDLLLKRWLIMCCTMVVLMIFLGGLTRLSEAGLSIVEWKPVSGILPPLDSIEWREEFAKYQQSPEYRQKNINMTLSEFKFIFWLEFIHRFAGRIAGLLYLLPLIYLLMIRQIAIKSLPIYLGILLLFLLQGAMGWYMVKSGLSLEPCVSHFRLAGHLVIAVVIYHLSFNQLLKSSRYVTNNDIGAVFLRNSYQVKFCCLVTIVIVYLQIFLGGLVAGLDAGLIYNTFPLMGDSFIPEEIANNLPVNIAGLKDSLSSPVFVQFCHRIGAYVVCVSNIFLVVQLVKIRHPRLNEVACYITGILTLQMLAGIITIIYSVPMVIALVHQLLAIMLLSCVLWSYFLLKKG